MKRGLGKTDIDLNYPYSHWQNKNVNQQFVGCGGISLLAYLLKIRINITYGPHLTNVDILTVSQKVIKVTNQPIHSLLLIHSEAAIIVRHRWHCNQYL